MTEQEIKDQWQDLVEFTYNHDVYKSSTTVRDYLNKIFSAKIKKAFITDEFRVIEPSNMRKFGLDWSGQSIILVNSNGELIHLTNSEWATFKLITK